MNLQSVVQNSRFLHTEIFLNYATEKTQTSVSSNQSCTSWEELCADFVYFKCCQFCCNTHQFCKNANQFRAH